MKYIQIEINKTKNGNITAACQRLKKIQQLKIGVTFLNCDSSQWLQAFGPQYANMYLISNIMKTTSPTYVFIEFTGQLEGE